MARTTPDSRAYVDRLPVDRRPRVALLHDGGCGHLALVSILSEAGLTPDAGVLQLRSVARLIGSPPDAVVLTADVGRGECLAAIRHVREQFPGARIAVVAPEPEAGLARRALDAGAQAFVPEDDAARLLVPAIHAIRAGLVCVPQLDKRAVAKPSLSHRERQVLRLLATGMTNAQIAERLHLGESTVKSHVASCFAKLGVRSRERAASLLSDPAEGLASLLHEASVVSPSG
jgi:DNA-binding NarL/FixJ family response regulator